MITYQDILKTAEELEGEQLEQQAKQSLNQLKKKQWLDSEITQLKLTTLRVHFESSLNDLLINLEDQNESWLRSKVAELKSLRTIIEQITE